ncbi:MAG: PIN domain-containing protein [Acidimicrobiales bacterium]
MVVDTGALVAAALADDADDERSAAYFDAAAESLVVSDLVVPEVCYLLAKAARASVKARFFRSVLDRTLTIEHVTGADLVGTAGLAEIYADLPLGMVDAAVVAVNERLGAIRIATLDRRHFSVVRPSHAGSFELLP